MKDKESIDKQEELVRQERAFKEMTPAMQAVTAKVQKLLAVADRGPIIIAWKIGHLLNPVATKVGIYGQDALKMLDEYLSLPRGITTLTDYCNLARKFDLDALKEEVAKPMANGRSLSLYHFIELLSISSLKKRAEVFAMVRRDCVSVGELRDYLVAHKLRSSVKKGGGRQMKRPTSPAAGLRRLAAHADKLVKYAGVLDEVFDGIQEMSATQVDDALVMMVDAAEVSASDAIECLEGVLEHLKAAKARIGRVLTARPKKAVPVAA